MNDEYDFVKIGQLVSELHVRKNPDCEWLCKHTSQPNLGETFDDLDDLKEQINKAKPTTGIGGDKNG